MTKGKTTKESMIEALCKLMETKKFQDIQISEITEKAGVSRISYYRNFESKEAILIAYMEQKTKAFYEDHSEEDDETYLLHLFEHIKDYADFIPLLYKNDLSYLFLQHIINWFGRKGATSNLDEYANLASSYCIFGFFNRCVFCQFIFLINNRATFEITDKF